MNAVRGGTPDFSGPSLCVTCRHSHTIKGRGMSEELTLCRAGSGMNSLQITRPVVECSEYENKNTPALWQMEKIAWKFSVDNANRPVGFLSPKRWKEKHGDED
jgi:hypothetical protein